MPAIGERKTKGGITGEWNGETWVRVSADAGAADPSPAAAGAPKVGERKTKNGVTGEWDGTTWRKVDGDAAAAAPAEGPSAGTVAAASALPAAGTLALALAKRGAEQVATSPLTGKVLGKVAKVTGRYATPAAAATGLYQLAHGDVAGAAKTGALAAAAKYGPRAALRVVGAVANAPAVTVPAAGAALGAGAGLALPAAALAAIQHDANRKPEIDPTRDTPASSILRGFLTMAGKR